MANMLAVHGTKAFALPAGAILAAAVRDLDVVRANSAADPGAWQQFAFHRLHVTRAKSPRHLLELALADIEQGLVSSKAQTVLLYSNPEWLAAALALASDAA